MKVLMATMLSFAVFSNAYAKESSDREYRKRFLQHSALRTCFGMMSRLARGMPELTNIEVTSLISRDYGNEQTLEVGAATRPVCTRCRQVDRYTSAFDMIKQNAKFDPRMRKKSDEELIRINMAFTLESREVLLAPFAVMKHPGGIIADARNIPLESNSQKLIIMKNFPWFHSIGFMNRTVLGNPVKK